jgi:hypothetical protein
MQLNIDSVNVVEEGGVAVRATIMGTLVHPTWGQKTWRQHLTGPRLEAYVGAANAQARKAALRAAVVPEVAKREGEYAAEAARSSSVLDEDTSLDLTP